MEKLVTVKDVMERYRCSGPTARKYIRQCNPHMENPLVTYSWALYDWEKGRLVGKSKKNTKRITRQMGRVIVPRRRESDRCKA